MAEEGEDPKTFEARYQGNKNSGGDRPEEAEQSGPAAETLEFGNMKIDVIRSQDGRFLIERVLNSEKSILGWTRSVRSENKNRALIWVYSYKSIPPADGTYVVLEFVQSGKFIFGKDTAPRLCVGEPDGDPVYPIYITTPTDSRVFLMKPTGSEVVFAWKGYVITLLPNPNNPGKPFGPCGLQPEGNGPKEEAQLFGLNSPKLRRKPGAESEEMEDLLEPVPY